LLPSTQRGSADPRRDLRREQTLVDQSAARAAARAAVTEVTTEYPWRHGEQHTANTTTKAPPRTTGRGLRHHRTSAPAMTPKSSTGVALNNIKTIETVGSLGDFDIVNKHRRRERR
jgi:hypothetical protein